MILIISNNNERTTNKIIEWLLEMEKEFIRIHEDEIFEIAVENKKILLRNNKNSFFLDEISSVWYRRGRLKIKRLRYENLSVNSHMNEVQHWLEDYVRTKKYQTNFYIREKPMKSLNRLL